MILSCLFSSGTINEDLNTPFLRSHDLPTRRKWLDVSDQIRHYDEVYGRAEMTEIVIKEGPRRKVVD